MSEPEAQPVVEAARCPRCGADLAPDQEWCLSCGTAARTAIAPTPNWRIPIALMAVVLALCGAAVAWALIELTENDAEVKASGITPITHTVPAPGVTTEPGTTEPGTTAPPAAATPPATTAPPAVEPPPADAPPAADAEPATP